MLSIAPHRKWLFFLALIAITVTLLVIMLGAFTRLVDAGLGCPDWPTCYGHVLWPVKADAIQTANAAFVDMPVETDKTWPEQVHRLFASSLGLISLLLFVVALRQSPDRRLKPVLVALVSVWIAALVAKIVIKANTTVTVDAFYGLSDAVIGLVVLAGFAVLPLLGRWQQRDSGVPLRLTALIVGVVVLQGLFGMWTVTLKVWPQVVTVHLLGGFSVLVLFWLLALRLYGRAWWLPAVVAARLRGLLPWAWLGLVIVVVQIALGGWTTSNYADVACPELPTCQGAWWPEGMDFRQGFNIFQQVGPNYLGGQLENAARVAIHKMHRLGAMVTFVYLLGLALALWRVGTVWPRRLAVVLTGVLTLQVALGLSNILFHFPVAVAVAHNVGGALLLLVMVTLLHRLLTVEAR